MLEREAASPEGPKISPPDVKSLLRRRLQHSSVTYFSQANLVSGESPIRGQENQVTTILSKGNLKIEIEKESATPSPSDFVTESSGDPPQNKTNSCDKMAAIQTFFRGIEVSPAKNVSNSPEERKVFVGDGPLTESRRGFQHSLRLPQAYMDRSDTTSRYEATSPMSSNVGSFYYDRLEEFLPEKKLIAERKLQRV